MDTRSKILTLDAALQLSVPLTLVTGDFDVLRAEHVRDLQEARGLAPRQFLMALVLPGVAPVLEQQARAEMVAALRVVDYVLAADARDIDRIIAALRPSRLVRLDMADERRSRQLREHVRNCHARESDPVSRS